MSDGNEMQSTTSPSQLEAYLKDLFNEPSKNIESAFNLVVSLISQQSCEIDSLKNAHQEALQRNDDISNQIERVTDELAKERSDAAAKLLDLKKDSDNLWATQEKLHATIDDRDDLLTKQEELCAIVGHLQQEIKVSLIRVCQITTTYFACDVTSYL